MSVGAQLRASREARGLSIEALAQTTRVQARILAAIERDDVAGVPPRPFGRGLVRAYAREMGLDADRIAREYFAQFAPPPPAPDQAASQSLQAPLEPPSVPTRQRRLWIPVAAAAGLAAGVALAVVLGRSRTAGAPPSPGIGTSGTATEAVASDAPSSPGADRPPVTPPPVTAVAPTAPASTTVPPAAPTAAVSVVLTAERPSWVTADADGRRALYLTLMPGAPQTITASREIVIRVGDAGSVTWQVNGRNLGSMGRVGQVRDITVTAANAASIQ
jgi:cytoskeletal protein RodZ